ncbi:MULTISPECIES: hypothetical protein [unclassified Brevibacterium]|uniref:hypothetical protein n=1 Tax=unclassified Brevibacterium TaxID=2614124 RepID=UPI0010F7A548|nr:MULTISPECIES: hypothetical protein [unclassified Brevibacterium]MCM1011640.1 hypothetical protein [Brevibacterium sp. XM4083]
MELADLFDAWNTNETPKTSRGFKRDPGQATQRHIEAMELFTETRRTLEFLSTHSLVAERCLQHVPKMARAILAVQSSWDSSQLDSYNFDPVMMEALRLAAYDVQRILDENTRHAPRVDDLLGEVRQILVEDESISGEMKRYINELLSSIRANIERNGLGQEFDFGHAMEQLWVALLAAQGASEDEKSRWAAAASQVKNVATGFIKYGAAWAALGFQGYAQFAIGAGR